MDEEFFYLPQQGPYLDIVSLDFKGLLADLFWVRTAVYFGHHYYTYRDKGYSYRFLYTLMDLATNLDPDYYDIYYYGSLILPKVEDSNRLLEKGRSRFSSDWKLPEMIGFNYYWYLKKPLIAARYYEEAAKKPGHPPFVPSMGSRLFIQGRDMEGAIRVLLNFYNTTKDREMKEYLLKRIEQIKGIWILEEAAEIYRQRFKKEPQRIEDLLKYKIIKEMPKEPFGGNYSWNKNTNRVSSDKIYY